MIAVPRRARALRLGDGVESAGAAPLEVKDVHRNFGAVAALRGITVSLGEPGVTGIIGPNGSGKTTLVNVITGILRPSSGRVMWHGRNIARCRPHVISRLGITRTFQQSMTFPRLSVEENFVIALEAAGRPGDDVEEFLSKDSPFPALAGFRRQQACEIPFGIGRLLGVALASVRRPRLIVLDEPAAGLNNVESAALAGGIKAVAARGASVTVIDHDMSFLLPLCRRLVVLDAGALIADGAPDQVRHDPQVISTYLGAGFVDA
jgi:ABC-type branched-subunit amino acid transport system ATPase component